MPKTILFISENEDGLKALPQSLRDSYIIHHTDSFHKAPAKLKHIGRCCLVIAEFPHDGKGCENFFKTICKSSPATVRLLLVSAEFFTMAHGAIKAASVFHLIERPYPADVLHLIVQKGVELFDSQLEKQRAMRQTLKGSVQAMVDILDMVNPEAMGFAKRIRQRVLDTGKALGVSPMWHLELAVMLSHIGCVALPTEIIQKQDRGIPLTPEEQQMFDMHSFIAASLISNIPSMAPVARIIQQQYDTLSDDQPLGSRIIKVALDVDHVERMGDDAEAALRKMLKESKKYDKAVVEYMLQPGMTHSQSNIVQLEVEELKEGMILAQDLVNKDGSKLILQGQPITKMSLNIIKSFHITLGIIEPILIQKPTPAAAKSKAKRKKPKGTK